MPSRSISPACVAVWIDPARLLARFDLCFDCITPSLSEEEWPNPIRDEVIAGGWCCEQLCYLPSSSSSIIIIPFSLPFHLLAMEQSLAI
jgi:hypothetical protein